MSFVKKTLVIKICILNSALVGVADPCFESNGHGMIGC